MSGLPPDDPHGDHAWQAEARRKKGRGALLDASLDFEIDDGEAAGPPTGGGPEGADPDAPAYDLLRIPRLIGKITRLVPLSLPQDGPVTPLGVQGGVFWYLNPHGELIGLKSNEFGQAQIDGLYAPNYDWLYRAFPQFNQQRQWKGFAAQYARAALMGAAAMKGVFDARDKVRGLGCWKADDGSLIQHLGDRILVGGKSEKPGEIGGFVYPGRPALEPPAAGGLAAAREVFERVQTWRWVRGALDARLFLGFQACMILGAALKWRPMIFITGDAGTGKSTLQDEMRALFPGRLVSTVDASPAALRQVLNQDAVAVSFDEIEADVLNDQAQQVMKLARVAASGGTVYRGGKDHSHAEFQLRGCFAFSAIIPPSMRQQDMQRFAFLRLQPLGRQAPPRALTPAEARALGAGIVGRITERWADWEGVLGRYKEALEAEGHAKRGAEQFGALLAAADLLLEDDLPDGRRLEHWARQLRRESLFEYEGNEPAWLSTWRHLLNAQPEVWRADGFPSVAEVVRKYLKTAGLNPPNLEERDRLQDRLGRAGLSIVQQRGTGRFFLAIPAKHQAIASIFAHSDLQKKGGEGAWTLALRGAPAIDEAGAGVYRVNNVPRLQRQKCTLYWLDAEADIAGVMTPIFDRTQGEDWIDAPIEREPGEEG